MRRRIELTNPFYDVPRFAFGFEHIRQHPDGARLLDYGCYDGQFGRDLRRFKPIEYFGVDKNADATSKTAEAGFEIQSIRDELPFPNDFFDVATIFEVLEHLNNQDDVLKEIRRVLRPGGILIASTPRKHVFSVLDAANLKFVFPRLHRIYYTLRHSREAYEYRYLRNPYGLVGDVDREKAWHQHFTDDEMRDLMERNQFVVEELDGAGLFSSVLEVIGWVVPPFRKIAGQELRNWDSYRFAQRMLFCQARKSEV